MTDKGVWVGLDPAGGGFSQPAIVGVITPMPDVGPPVKIVLAESQAQAAQRKEEMEKQGFKVIVMNGAEY
jgi:hypothetical protein